MSGAAAIVPTSTSDGEPERDPRVPERPPQDRQVALLQAARRSIPGLGVDLVAVGVEQRLARPQEPVGQHRHDRQRDEQRRGHRDRDRQGERAEELARDVADEGDRQEHRDRGDGRRRDRGGDLAHGAKDRLHLVGVADVVTFYVLDHDDGVVDHAPDRDRERTERQDVQREPERLDADERDQHARRDRDGRHEGRAHRHQEHQDDDDGEEEAEQALDREALDRLLDVGSLVEHDGERRAVQARPRDRAAPRARPWTRRRCSPTGAS